MGSLLERLDETNAEPPRDGTDANGEALMESILRRVQNRLLADCAELVTGARGNPRKRKQLRSVILQMIVKDGLKIPGMPRESLVEAIVQETAGFGPIDPFILDQGVSEIMVNGSGQVYVERSGALELTDVTFRDDEHLLEVIGRIVAPLGRRLDRASPYVDARLPDGSRVNAIIPPLSLTGPVLTVRKFPGKAVALQHLVCLGTITPEMASFLNSCVRARLNIIISGGTGSGKTTTLGTLCSAASPCDRIITIEDAAELRIDLPHVINLESRPPNIEGKGSVTIRSLLRNALRMRPDRIIIGEVRGAEAFDLLQALNTGHMGSMSTVHANSVIDAMRRLENMVLSSGESVPHEVVEEDLKSAIDLMIQQERTPDGLRKVTDISLVTRVNGGKSRKPVHRVFSWEPEGACGVPGGRFVRHTVAGRIPQVTAKFRLCGMNIENWLGGGDL